MTQASLISSRAEFAAAVQWGVTTAVERGARRLWFADPNFVDWPLDDPVLLASLTAWVRLPQRQLWLLAETFDEMVRSKPRFVAWRRPWSHVVQAWSPQDLPAELPTVVLDDGSVCVALADRLHWRGRAAVDAREARHQREQVEAILQRSAVTFPVSSLGL